MMETSICSSVSVSRQPVCRICLEAVPRRCDRSSEDANKLLKPCRCKGSMAHVHEDCLLQWIKASGRSTCELCNEHFRFSRTLKPIREWRFAATPISRKSFAYFCVWLMAVAVSVCFISWQGTREHRRVQRYMEYSKDRENSATMKTEFENKIQNVSGRFNQHLAKACNGSKRERCIERMKNHWTTYPADYSTAQWVSVIMENMPALMKDEDTRRKVRALRQEMVDAQAKYRDKLSTAHKNSWNRQVIITETVVYGILIIFISATLLLLLKDGLAVVIKHVHEIININSTFRVQGSCGNSGDK